MIAFEDIDLTQKKDIIIDNFMMSNDVYLLVSLPKVGKSMLALQLSYCITNGTPFLGYSVKPSPVLYITTESNIFQIFQRMEFMNLKPKDKSLFLIDRCSKEKISLSDIKDKLLSFSSAKQTRLLIIDMMKDFDIGINYDINDFQDVSQKLMPKLRCLAEEYNLTILLTHHLNKRKETLGSIGLEACVDGVFTLIDMGDNKHIQLKSISRDFPALDLSLIKNDKLVLNVCEESQEEVVDNNLILFIKYASSKIDFDFTPTEIVNKANLFCTPKKFGRLLNSNLNLLAEEGLHITKNRTANERIYHCHYEEPSQEND